MRVLFEAAEAVKRWTRASLVEGVGRREVEACEVEACGATVAAERHYSPEGNVIRTAYLERTQALRQMRKS